VSWTATRQADQYAINNAEVFRRKKNVATISFSGPAISSFPIPLCPDFALLFPEPGQVNVKIPIFFFS
jgi:hypothetical protein